MGALHRVSQVPNGQIAQWIRFAASAIVIPAVIAMLVWVVAIERRLTSIESNRFKAQDGLRLVEMINAKADKVDVPPPEVRQRLDRLDREMERKADAELIQRLDKDIQEIKAMIRGLQR